MEETKKRRGRPSRTVKPTDVQTEESQQSQMENVDCTIPAVTEEIVEKQISEAHEEVTEKTTEQVVETESTKVPKEITELADKEKTKKYCTHHNYKIGDKVWVPVNVVKNVGSVFGTINAIQLYEPKRTTVASVIITNHVCYSFKESPKLIVAERYMCDTQEDCILMCNKLMSK